MRVLHVHWTARPVTGGVEAHLGAVVHQLGALPCAVGAVAGTRESPGVAYEAALDLQVPAADAEVSALVSRCAGADLVHWHNPQWHKPTVVSAVVSALQDRGWRGRFVFDLHNIDEQPAHWEFLARLPGRLVAHSPFVAEEARGRLGGREVAVLPLALPLREEPYTLPCRDRTVVLQPTRMTRWKGSHLSLEAVLTLLEEGADLHFAHAGTRHLIWPPGIPETLLERARDWREKGRVHFVHYTPEQSWAAIRQSDIVLHPTIDRGAHGEPFSLSVAQAVVCGRQVIASDSGHLPRILGGYSAGRIVPAGDLRALTDALREAVRKPLVGQSARDLSLARELREGLATAGAAHLRFYGSLSRS
ncbi:glycosyltransferase family 4 protein [Streptomyces pathocidini]|uniref:D-inositol 3-phosphate glycosyltransferase n=1 Tax=Streptomyces pathocidini TaxID=1650571 RepID=A0ABW7UUX0_9ACTN|nr:glycosyltransferase family 4 protein [Streptomyces pathocidini]